MLYRLSHCARIALLRSAFSWGLVDNSEELDAIAKLVEHWSRMRDIMGSNAGRVKPMTYKIYTCRFLARCSALLG